MLKLIVFDQICYGCQVPLNAQIRVIAEMIKSQNLYNNKMQRNNAILLARLVSIPKMSSLPSKIAHNSGQNFHLYAACSVSYWQTYFGFTLQYA